MRTTRLHGLGFALLLSLSLVSSGCFAGAGDGGGGTDGGTNGSTDGGTTSGACQGVVCNTNQVCDPNSGNCVECLADSDCPTGGTCNTSTHTCSNGGGGGGGGAKGPACTSNQSCAQGQVCDNGTCQPGAYGDCSKLACAAGMDCVNAGANGQNAQECLTPCTATSDCPDTAYVCDTGSGDVAVGHCIQNLCSPNIQAAGVFGDLHAVPAQFGAACDAAGTGDGTCWGPLQAQAQQSGTLKIGLCFANGQVAPGGTCDAAASYSNLAQACNGGLCLPTSQTGTQGTCAALCAVADGQNCAAVNGNPTACLEFQGLAGVCFPQDASPAATGASCTAFSQSHQSLSCVEDDTCQSGSCMQWCDQTATTSTCPSGKTCTAVQQGDILTGTCQ